MLRSRRIKTSRLFLVPILVAMLAGCGDSGDFDTSSSKDFVLSCERGAYNIAQQINNSSGYNDLTAASVADFFSIGEIPPPRVEIRRDFDPTVTIPVAGEARLAGRDVAAACSLSSGALNRFDDVSMVEALRLGLSQEMSNLSGEIEEANAVHDEILERQSDARSEAIKLRQEMDQYAPRGVTFQIANVNGQYIPSVAIDAANVVGRPITAFLLTIRLVGWDGSVIGVGKVRFIPPVPLGPGIESTYVLNLVGVHGIDTPAVVNYSGAVKVVIGLDDLIVEGRPLLKDLQVEAGDQVRLDALDVLIDGLVSYRQFILTVRQREIGAFGG